MRVSAANRRRAPPTRCAQALVLCPWLSFDIAQHAVPPPAAHVHLVYTHAHPPLRRACDPLTEQVVSHPPFHVGPRTYVCSTALVALYARRAPTRGCWHSAGSRQLRTLEMQAAGAGAGALMASGPGPQAAPIEWLPDEVLDLLFRFVDTKALVMAVPAVSARGCA